MRREEELHAERVGRGLPNWSPRPFSRTLTDNHSYRISRTRFPGPTPLPRPLICQQPLQSRSLSTDPSTPNDRTGVTRPLGSVVIRHGGRRVVPGP